MLLKGLCSKYTGAHYSTNWTSDGHPLDPLKTDKTEARLLYCALSLFLCRPNVQGMNRNDLTGVCRRVTTVFGVCANLQVTAPLGIRWLTGRDSHDFLGRQLIHPRRCNMIIYRPFFKKRG